MSSSSSSSRSKRKKGGGWSGMLYFNPDAKEGEAKGHSLTHDELKSNAGKFGRC